MDYTIQNGTVIDGTGTTRYAADVLLRDGRIAEVAPHLPPVGEVIEARGMIVCPGFSVAAPIRAPTAVARDMGLLTLEEAVRKMTSLPAEILHLGDRGVLHQGKAADVVVFNPQTIRERASYEDPRQYPEGLPYVFVNGRPVIAGGRSTGARPGHLLQHQG